MTKEVWCDIPDTDGLYQASDQGNVRSKKKGHVHLMAKKHNNFTGYDYVILYLPSGPKTVTIHRLVATTFTPNPDSLPEVNHINEVKSDNRAINLGWVTAHENNEHSKWKRLGVRDPAKQYVTMTAETFMAMVAGGRDLLGQDS